MDSQYPFASKDDIWRVQQEMKDLYSTQAEHAERILRLERRRDDDARMKNVWGPQSPFPGILSGGSQNEHTFNPAAEEFRSFDHEPQTSMMSSLHLDHEDEPKRGASRANSVRFDENAIHYAQGSRSSELLPMRTGSGMSSHPLTERSLSHRSDGRQSSSARTNSLGLEGSRLLASVINSPLTPGLPPGLFILGPVPCIIRCWLTQNFSNDSLLYAAVCSGSYKSSIDIKLLSQLDFDHLIRKDEGGTPRIKLPVFLPEATVSQASSRSNSPVPQLPALTVNFIVRNFECNDKSIQVVLGSDVLRTHAADISFSQDKLAIFDDERNRITVPFVRPEDDHTFKGLCTTSITSSVTPKSPIPGEVEENLCLVEQQILDQPTLGIIGRPTRPSLQAVTASHTPFDTTGTTGSQGVVEHFDGGGSEIPQAKTSEPVDAEKRSSSPSRHDPGSIWGSWRRDSSTKADSNSQSSTASNYRSSRGRGMKVLRPSKAPTSTNPRSFSAAHPVSGSDNMPLASRSSEIMSAGNGMERDIQSPMTAKQWPRDQKTNSSSEGLTTAKSTRANPVGEASAFPWLSSAPSGGVKRATTAAE